MHFCSYFQQIFVVSHQPKRAQKDCLNCGAHVEERYCPICGQENIVTKQSAAALFKHFLYDIFHFDGKFFETLKDLFLRPGSIAKEYVQGRRGSYLDPIRMYLFTSALFFLIFFAVVKPGAGINITGQVLMNKTKRFDVASMVHRQMLQSPADTFLQVQLRYLLDTAYRVSLIDTTSNYFRRRQKDLKKATLVPIRINDTMYYIRPEKRKPDTLEGAKDSSLVQGKIAARWEAYKLKYGDDNHAMLTDFSDAFIHKFPYLLFLSLPVFALILKLLYRRRKAFVYSDHAVFTLYHYIFSFFVLLFMFGLGSLEGRTKWSIFQWLIFGLMLLWAVYLYKGLRRFYGQGRLKTIGKFLLLNIFGFIAFVALLLLFLLFTVYQV